MKIRNILELYRHKFEKVPFHVELKRESGEILDVDGTVIITQGTPNTGDQSSGTSTEIQQVTNRTTNQQLNPSSLTQAEYDMVVGQAADKVRW